MKRILPGIIAVASTLYICDYLSARARPMGTVDVRRYYAVALKNNKIEYMFDSAAAQECVHSLLPQIGRDPCWYLERHKMQMIDVSPPRVPKF